jgi:hypothetical protein
VVAVDARRGRPGFWGEAGHVGPEKRATLVDRYPGTHLAMAKWDTPLAPTREAIECAVHTTDRTAPIDLIRIPPDRDERCLDGNRRVSVSWDAVRWIRIGHAAPVS